MVSEPKPKFSRAWERHATASTRLLGAKIAGCYAKSPVRLQTCSPHGIAARSLRVGPEFLRLAAMPPNVHFLVQHCGHGALHCSSTSSSATDFLGVSGDVLEFTEES